MKWLRHPLAAAIALAALAFGSMAQAQYAQPFVTQSQLANGTLPVAGSSLAAGNITGSTQCVQANSSGALSGSGAPCGGSGGVTSVTGSNGVNCSPTTGAAACQQDGTLPTLSGNNNFTGQETLSFAASGAGQPALTSTGALYSGGGAQATSSAYWTYDCAGSTQPSNWNSGGYNSAFINLNFCSAAANSPILQAFSNGGGPYIQILNNGAIIVSGYISAGQGNSIGIYGRAVWTSPASTSNAWVCGQQDAASPTPCIIRGQGVNAGTSNGNGVSTTLGAGPGTGSGTSGSLNLATGSSVSDAGTAHTITAFSGSASPYTITATGSTAYPVGGIVTIAGASPSSLNGSYTVTASSAGSFTATTTQTGTWTSGGTATYSATQQNPAVTGCSIAGAVGSTPGLADCTNFVGQRGTYNNVTGSRVLGTTYTNSTGKVMYISAWVYANAAGGTGAFCTFNINGAAVWGNNLISTFLNAPFFGIANPGDTYQLICGSGGSADVLGTWMERY